MKSPADGLEKTESNPPIDIDSVLSRFLESHSKEELIAMLDSRKELMTIPDNVLDNMKGGRIDIARKQLAQIYREAELRAQLATCQKELSETKASNERMREALLQLKECKQLHFGPHSCACEIGINKALSQPNQKEEV